MTRCRGRQTVGGGQYGSAWITGVPICCQQLADTAKELGIEINLNYSFAQPPATEGPSVVDVETVAADVTDPVSVPAADAADDAAAADAARELRIAAQPETGARPVRAARSKPPYR